MSDTWTIGELAERAADVLRAHAAPLNGRVRDVPGARLIRWYTTIGLVDPPLTRRGRIARYGRRHLLQLVAIKRLQARGMSIADIQVTLAGATDATLETTAQLPATPLPDGGHQAPAAPPVPAPPSGHAPAGAGAEAAHLPPGLEAHHPPEQTSRGAAHSSMPSASPAPDAGDVAARRGRFWTDRPAQETGRTVQEEDRLRQDAGCLVREAGRPGRVEDPGSAAVHGVRLASGVVLVLDGTGRAPGDDDVQAVLAAAAPLLAVLEERGLR